MDYYKVFLDVVDKIKEQSDTCALLLIGKTSHALENQFNSLNDVDLLVVTDKNKEFERQVEDIEGVPFDISFISIYDLITQVEAKSTLWINMTIGAKIYYSKNELIFGIVDRVKDIYYSGTVKLKEEDVHFIRFNLTQKCKDVSKRMKDVVLSSYLMIKLFDRIIEDYYKLNSIWYPNSKYLFDNLEAVDPVLSKLSKDFIYECTASRKLVLLKELLERVLEPFGGLSYTWPKGPYEITL